MTTKLRLDMRGVMDEATRSRTWSITWTCWRKSRAPWRARRPCSSGGRRVAGRSAWTASGINWSSATARVPEHGRYVVFPFFVFELVNRYVFPFRQRLHGLAESLRHLSQHHWRWNRLAQLVAHEHRQLGSGCQPADIAVEVETVEALHFQRDVPIKEFRDGCHSRILRQSWAVCSSV